MTTQVWSAREVQAAVTAAGTGTVTVEKEILFEDLPLYAPNGSEYVYSIQEVKTNLGAMTPGPAPGISPPRPWSPPPRTPRWTA